MARKLKTAAVIAVGDELLAGRVDTNGPALEAQLQALGLEPRERRALPDDEAAVAAAVRELTRKHDLVLCCGGLGPTQDDVTRQAIARALRLPLVTRPEWSRPIEAYFQRMRRPMPTINRIQAMLPEGASHVMNHWGTAQGFAVASGEGGIVAALPGPPRECLPMMSEILAPWLKKNLRLAGPLVHTATLRVAGEAEAWLQVTLAPLFPKGSPIMLGFLLDEPGEILVKLKVENYPASAATKVLDQAVRQVGKTLGADVVDAQARPLPQVVGCLLRKKRQTLTVAESCTGGLIARRMTTVSGSGHYFLEGAVTYHNRAKTRRLRVPRALLEKHGAVSAETALAMARGMRRTSLSDWSIGVTGIAGPTGGTRSKPVGLVYAAVCGPDGATVQELRYNGDRDFIQRRSATAALDLLRRRLLQS